MFSVHGSLSRTVPYSLYGECIQLPKSNSQVPLGKGLSCNQRTNGVLWFCQQALQKKPWNHTSKKQAFPHQRDTQCRWQAGPTELCKNTRAQAQVLLSTEQVCCLPQSITFRWASLFQNPATTLARGACESHPQRDQGLSWRVSVCKGQELS